MSDAMLDARQEGGSYCRIEVITRQRRRRRWTAEEKARIVAESFAAVFTVVRMLTHQFRRCAMSRAYNACTMRGPASGRPGTVQRQRV
jgi:transposase-like protein